MESRSDFPAKYVAILRCRTWGQWPEWTRKALQAYEDPLTFADGRNPLLSVHLATYAKRTRPEATAAKPLNKAGPLLWRGHMDTGYWLGMQFLKAPEDVVPVRVHLEEPYEGEIDIQLHIGLTETAALDDLSHIASQIATTILALVNLSTGEFLVPVAPVQVRTLSDDGSQFKTAVLMAVRRRPEIVLDTITGSIERFMRIRVNQDRHTAHAVSAAARRYVTSHTETDLIDKYCDLWECCEFATLSVKAKGGKVGRIAQALATHWNATKEQGRVRKADVERVMEIKQLHTVRGRIVHEALDAARDLKQRSDLLEGLAAELLRYSFGLPFSSAGEVFERLSSIASGTHI